MAIIGSPVSAQTSYFTQQGPKLVPSAGNGYPNFGQSVALSADGNTAIVGAPNDDAGIGGAWVFTRTVGVWMQQGPKLVGSGAVGVSSPRGNRGASQGTSVALSADGNTAIIGGDFDHTSSQDFADGAAWVFTRTAGVWTQEGPKLVGSGAVGGAWQGVSVTLSADGNTAMVGGSNDTKSRGAVWVFARTAGIWKQQGPKLVGSGCVEGCALGRSVALSGDGNTAILSGYGVKGAWVFARKDGVWTQQGNKLRGTGEVKESDRLSMSGDGSGQGFSVALSADGNTAAIGGPYDSWPGAVWIFTRTGDVWTQQGNKLVGSGRVDGSGDMGRATMQGSSVALSGDGNTAIVGGPDDDAYAGAAWVFTRTEGVWSQSGPKLTGSDAVRGTAQGAVKGSLQGGSVALSADGTTAIVGGLGDANIGAAWVYSMKPSLSSDAPPSSPKRADLPAPKDQASTLEPQRAKDFALSLQGLWSRPNSEMLAALDDVYEDEVMFYGKKTTRKAVLKDKLAFATRFPQREYKPKEPISVLCGDDRCTVHGLVDFRAVDPVARVVSSGVATFEYQFMMMRPKLKITMENGKVLSRTREPLSPAGVSAAAEVEDSQVEGSYICQQANSPPPPCKGCSPWVIEKLRQKDLKRIQEARQICAQLKRQEFERKEAAKRQQVIEEAKRKEEAERWRKAEQERQLATAARAQEMRKPINRLRTAYEQYMYVTSCHRAREGYLVVWINDVEMDRARQAVTRLEKEILREDSTINVDEVWNEIAKIKPSTVYEYNCKPAYNELIMAAPGQPTIKDFGQH
ncbi:hypothetical protein [Bradyrhizobium sp. SZCCHNRI2014]|uniref:WD40 repeat domain-containing protein n=1 Tax=Bradyrhizobium sp. SZCCHNRI2014 TaxID=3057285 RepID=UPI002916CC8C|nr:hypothetical protein [Bradyrhizobium sp. SZCCHNRI2014]